MKTALTFKEYGFLEQIVHERQCQVVQMAKGSTAPGKIVEEIVELQKLGDKLHGLAGKESKRLESGG